MAKQLGRALLVEIWDIALNANAGGWAYLCGMQSKTFSRAAELLDVTTANKADPTGPLNKQVMIVMNEYGLDGDLFFEDADNFSLMNDPFEARMSIKVKLTMPEIGSWECDGGWALSKLDITGELKGAITCAFAFEPTDKVDFTKL